MPIGSGSIRDIPKSMNKYLFWFWFHIMLSGLISQWHIFNWWSFFKFYLKSCLIFYKLRLNNDNFSQNYITKSAQSSYTTISKPKIFTTLGPTPMSLATRLIKYSEIIKTRSELGSISSLKLLELSCIDLITYWRDYI